ncbi:MAG: hypothetical protein H6765_05945 [Candidatus Peribacteria bacterium]|nr:MAG: hypothetical protein H6765_05945 [Candidatus Peribacteria bacterium]
MVVSDCLSAKPEDFFGQVTGILKDIVGGIFFISGQLDSLENDRKDEEECYCEYNTEYHKSNTIPGVFDLVRVACRKDEKKNSIKE